jgi:MFS family permease
MKLFIARVGLLLALVPPSQTGLLYTLMFLFGGLSLPLYGIFVALAGDMLAPEELVAASSKILLVNGLGSAIGPVFVAWLMHGVGTAGYALFIAVVHAAAAMITMPPVKLVPHTPMRSGSICGRLRA